MSILRHQAGFVRTVVLLVVVALAAGAGWYFILRDTTDDGRVSSDEPQASPSSSLDEADFVEEKWGTEVVRVEREAEVQGEQRTYIQIYFTSNSEGFAIAQKADQCTKSYLKEFDSASCYGFPSVESIEYAGVDPETGEMKNICWLGYSSRAKGGKKVIRIDNGQAEAQGCPS